MSKGRLFLCSLVNILFSVTISWTNWQSELRNESMILTTYCAALLVHPQYCIKATESKLWELIFRATKD